MVTPVFRSKSGFTLIELMIVVVIIGILASIAIPQFIRYQLKSKTSEVTRNVGSIRGLEEGFVSKYGEYMVASGVPTGVPDTTKRVWNPPAGNAFITLGFAPTGGVYYQYGIGVTITTAGTTTYAADSVLSNGGVVGGVTPTGGSDIYITGTGNLDGDTVYGNFYITDQDTQFNLLPSTTGEMVF